MAGVASSGKHHAKVTDESTAFWRAVAQVHLDRPAGLSALEALFVGGTVPGALSAIAKLEIDVFIQGARLAMKALGASA